MFDKKIFLLLFQQSDDIFCFFQTFFRLFSFLKKSLYWTIPELLIFLCKFVLS